MNRRQLGTLYKKEIMDVLRDKKTILTMVVLPVILYPLLFVVIMQVVSMINTAQQEETYYIAYDQVSEENKQALNEWIAGKDDNLDYVIKAVESEEPLKDLEDEIIDAYISIQETEGQQIFEIHYLSAVNKSSTVSDMLEEEIDSYGKNIAETNAKEQGLDVKKVLYPVKSTFKDQSSNESSIGSILGSIIPFLMITSILMGAMYPAIDATAGEKERGTLETLLTLPIGNMELIMSKFLSVATISVVSVFINVLSMGGIAAYLYATISALTEGAGTFRLGSFLPAILISVVCVIAFALFISAVVMCVCAFAKSFKEANNYVTPVTLVVMLTGYIGFIPNIELTSKTALIPVANICLLIKALLVFKYDFTLILMVLLSNIIYAFVAVWVLGRIYNSESILFGESASGIRLFERRKNIKKGSLPTIQESLLVMTVALLISVYVGGVLSVSKPIVGTVFTQLLLGGLPLLACIYTKGDIRKIFRLHMPSIKGIVGALFMYLGVGSLVLLIGNVLSILFPSGNEQLSESYLAIVDGVPFGVALLVIALMPAINEELLYRGYMLTAFSQKMKPFRAMFFVSVLFAISHMSLLKMLPMIVLGMALAYTMEKGDSIVASSLIHFLNNALAVTVMYYGEQMPGLQVEQFNVKFAVVTGLLSLACIPLAIMILKDGKGKLQNTREVERGKRV